MDNDGAMSNDEPPNGDACQEEIPQGIEGQSKGGDIEGTSPFLVIILTQRVQECFR